MTAGSCRKPDLPEGIWNSSSCQGDHAGRRGYLANRGDSRFAVVKPADGIANLQDRSSG